MANIKRNQISDACICMTHGLDFYLHDIHLLYLYSSERMRQSFFLLVSSGRMAETSRKRPRPSPPTLDTPFNTAGTTARKVITEHPSLKMKIFDPWPQPVLESKRASLSLIDHPTFGYHKWFIDFFDLPQQQRTADELVRRLKVFVAIRKRYFFDIKKRDIDLVQHHVGFLNTWCKLQDDFAIRDGSVMAKFVKWYFRNHHVPVMENVHRARYDYLRKGVSSWQHVMELQRWYEYDNFERKKSTDALQISLDGEFKELKEKMHRKSNAFASATNTPVEHSRQETKALSAEHNHKYVELFNELKEYGTGTPQDVWKAISDYACLSINHNVGLRSESVRTMCYSWFKYYEVAGMVGVGGLYMNSGNPAGYKVRNAQGFVRAEYFVRNVDVRMCTIGSLIKLIVAMHDIYGDTSLLDQVEASIRERETATAAARIQVPPVWHDYRVLRSRDKSNEPMSHSVYSAAIKSAHELIGAARLTNVTHEPHNRVGNEMRRIGVDTDSVARFLGWTTGNDTTYNKLYAYADVDVPNSLARAGHKAWRDNVYNCPRDGMDEDFADFEDIRQMVLKGRVPGLLQRARAVNERLRKMGYPKKCDDTSVLFLEMLDMFLIRVWLEDAAILQPRYPESVCYKKHPVFSHPRWAMLVKHLRTLRGPRGDARSTAETYTLAVSSPPDVEESSPPSESRDNLVKLQGMMRQARTDLTIESLYTWRRRLIRQWLVVYPDKKRGISKEMWQSTGAGANRSLYQHTSALHKYIDASSDSLNVSSKDVVKMLQTVVTSLGLTSRDFAENQFRILVGKKSVGDEGALLKITKQQLDDALVANGLPIPTPKTSQSSATTQQS